MIRTRAEGLHLHGGAHSRLWWRLDTARRKDRRRYEGNLLADGIFVDHGLPWIIADLRGDRAPLLDASRNEVHAWAAAWVIHHAMQGVSALGALGTIPLPLLWWVEQQSPRACRNLLAVLCAKHAKVSTGSGLVLSDSVDCFPPDETGVLLDRGKAYETIPNWTSTVIQAWRAARWRSIEGTTASSPSTALLPMNLGVFRSDPGDAALLGLGENARKQDRALSSSRWVSRANLVQRSAQAELSIREAAERLQSLAILGIRPMGWDASDSILDEMPPAILKHANIVDGRLVLTRKALRLWLVSHPSAQPCDLLVQRPILDRLGVIARGIEWDALKRVRLTDEQRQVLNTHDFDYYSPKSRRAARQYISSSAENLGTLFFDATQLKPKVGAVLPNFSGNPLLRIAASRNLDGLPP